ncbi:MAG: histidine phosphatase family protein [Alphaproteobacteria bacterium]|nr:histidine phosphatase family protein [Alphaproteobacteria bacterium]
MEKHFFLFRHGQTTYNINGFIQGQTNDSVLTETGIVQAFHIGNVLRQYPLDILISSPLKRALQTSEQVLKHFPNLPFKTDNRLTEVNVGEIEGLHYTVVQEKFQEKYQQWRSSHPDFQDMRFVGGESKTDVRTRLFEALNDYAEKTNYTHIAVSGHGILLSQMLLALGHDIPHIENGTVLHLIWDNRQWTLKEKMNSK